MSILRVSVKQLLISPKNILAKLKRNLIKQFGEITKALQKYNKPTIKDVTDLELLRMKYGELLEINKIEHQLAWHSEIQTICPSAPRVE
jgi:hypothetical protein